LSLIEVLVALGVIVLAIGLLLPATRRVRESAARVSCANNLKQLALALHSYSERSGVAADAPAGHAFPPGCFGSGTTPEDRLAWTVVVLPYMEQAELYRQFDPKTGYSGNLPAARTPIKLFFCPESEVAPGEPLTCYVAMSGIGLDAAERPAGAAGNGFMGYDRRTTLAMIEDGTSNTIALLETRSGLGPWARGGTSNVRGVDPADVPLVGEGRPFGGHTKGMNAAMADGWVRFLSSGVEPKCLAAAITIAGGEQPSDLDR
jgi:type II secretory pathway pseudopilin PulG